MSSEIERDFERFKRELPSDFSDHVRETYGIDLTARYLGETVPHPIGKGSGQLSLNENQLAEDARAGLAFVVLKTLIAQDEAGSQSMAAWAIHDTRMKVERWGCAGGRAGSTVTWKGRGWDRSFEEYLALVRAGRDLTRAGSLLVVPSVKYHLPRLADPFRDSEYRYTTRLLADAWGAGAPPLLVEKDFSPTLAGDALAGDRDQIMRWLREVPGRIRAAAPRAVRLAVKLMNARFDDVFQLDMMEACRDADALVCFNRLFDAEQGVAYGGWDLSARNLRVLDAVAPDARTPLARRPRARRCRPRGVRRVAAVRVAVLLGGDARRGPRPDRARPAPPHCRAGVRRSRSRGCRGARRRARQPVCARGNRNGGVGPGGPSPRRRTRAARRLAARRTGGGQRPRRRGPPNPWGSATRDAPPAPRR